jgi:hypothetical protein
MSTGQVLFWDDSGHIAEHVQLWTPYVETMNPVGAANGLTDQIFCAGHAGLGDGSVLVGGGAILLPGGGLTKATNIFNGTWHKKADMNVPRFYPSFVTLRDGKIMAFGGSNGATGDPWLTPEIYDPLADTWTLLPSATMTPWLYTLYPYVFLCPDNRIVMVGAQERAFGDPPVPTNTWVLDVAAPNPQWEMLSTATSSFSGEHGCAVMYEPGKVLKCGGFGPNDSITDKTATINFNDSPPSWTELPTMEMNNPREEHNLVTLPDGKILAIGGTDANGEAVLPAEWFIPNGLTPHWETLAPMTCGRSHHSVAVLLPDGTVLFAGELTPDGDPGCNFRGEIFSPPYLFTGPQPVVSYAPGALTPSQAFTVRLSGPVAAGHIGQVSLIRLAAVTHSFDQNQRFVPLAFSVVDSTTLRVIAPSPGPPPPGVVAQGSPDSAPPGSYMLFVVSDEVHGGVPAVARYVQILPNVAY